MERLLEDTIDQYFNKKKINEEAANDILKAYDDIHDIKNYANEVTFLTKKSADKGNYDHVNKKVLIYPKRIQNKVFTMYSSNLRYDKIEIKLYNLEMLEVLFHEITHAEQTKIRDTQNGFAAQIFTDSNNLFMTKPHKYATYYQYMPEEYNAYFKAYLTLQQYEPAWAKELVDNFATFFYYYYGKFGSSPYENFERISKFRREIPDMSLYDKAQYGLPMNKAERSKVLYLAISKPDELDLY